MKNKLLEILAEKDGHQYSYHMPGPLHSTISISVEVLTARKFLITLKKFEVLNGDVLVLWSVVLRNVRA